MNEREIEVLESALDKLEDAWWACDTSEAEEFLNSLINQIHTKLREVKNK